MRSPVICYRSLGLCCLVLAVFLTPVWAETTGVITGVRMDDQGRTVEILSKGKPGRHLSRVIGQPNRLVIDFDKTRIGKMPRRIAVGAPGIKEIRVGHYKGRGRVVVDFQKNPVPAFKIKRGPNGIRVVLGREASDAQSAKDDAASRAHRAKRAPGSHLKPNLVPAVANPSGAELKAPSAPAANPRSRGADRKRMKLAQGLELDRPSSQPSSPGAPPGGPPSGGPRGQALRAPAPSTSVPARRIPSTGDAGGRMVREVRPPVTPPTPDPRLLVQEVTELKFIQVGHNSRLIVRGGDHLDYRLNKVSPTKVRLDLINAEIPKAHQRPLRTDLFSTSVEMIVPGSQSIFVQLKEAVPYQVEKKKGVLMIDFPPPRFTLTEDQKAILRPGDQAGREAVAERREALESRREAARIRKEYLLSQQAETYEKQIRDLLKEQEEILKERREVENKYPIVTPDPEIFSKRVTLDFEAITLKNAFRLLAEQAGLNIIVGNEVKGTATVRLFQVPLGQVIDHLLNTNNLAKDVVGNVMWIGSKANIQRNKEARMRERGLLLGEVQKKLDRNREMRESLEKKREDILKELAKDETETEAAPGELTTFETVGATETIEIGGEPVTLLLVKVKLSYANVNAIKPILECVFNRRCQGVQPPPAETQAQALTAAAQELQQQGFSPDSPGGQARLQRVQRELDRERRTQAAEQMAQQMTGQQATQALRGAGLDERMKKILAHTVIWANAQYNMLFIKDLPERIEEMKKLISTLDVPVPQVLIESRLVRADRNWSRGLGVQWGGNNNQLGPLKNNRTAIWGLTGLEAGSAANDAVAVPVGPGDIPSTFAVNLPTSVANLGNLMGIGVQFGLLATDFATNLDTRIQFGEAAGQAKVIARPKVAVIDGQTANITSGQQIAFSTVSADGTQTQLVNVDLKLDVTPKVYPDGRVEMTLAVSDNDVGPIVNGLSSILTREANTVLIVKDGATAVIGGILRESNTRTREGWPGLMNMPIVNFLFTNNTRSKTVEELLVFITPTIIKKPPAAS